jgi:hypothetical protein
MGGATGLQVHEAPVPQAERHAAGKRERFDTVTIGRCRQLQEPGG